MEFFCNFSAVYLWFCSTHISFLVTLYSFDLLLGVQLSVCLYLFLHDYLQDCVSREYGDMDSQAVNILNPKYKFCSRLLFSFGNFQITSLVVYNSLVYATT